jgi:hypothetical protein
VGLSGRFKAFKYSPAAAVPDSSDSIFRGMTGHSGKKIVPLLYGAAVLLCAGLLWYGLSIRGQNASAPLGNEDRAIIADLPGEWTRITAVEGQGWAIYVPCRAEAGSLVVDADDENPRLLCAWCDTIQEGMIRRVSLKGQPPRPVRLKLDGGGTALIEPVDAAVLARFPGAPLRDYVLTWTQPDGSAMFFVPAVNAGDFEVLRAEDESPEGCLGN